MMFGFVSFITALGVAIGSFVNVVAIRVPAGRSLGGRSHCTTCDAELRAPDLVPIVSWMALRGHCRHCGSPVGASYVVGEAVCGLLFLVLAAHFGPHLVLVPYLALAGGLVALSAADFRTFRLPDRILGPLTVLVLAGFIVTAVIDGEGHNLGRAVAAAAVATGALGLLHVAYPKGLGFGDVKLAFVLGLATGWVSWGVLGLAIFLAALLGSTFGVVGAWVAREPVRGRKLPFGPFLSAGALLAAVVGPGLLHWYTGLLG